MKGIKTLVGILTFLLLIGINDSIAQQLGEKVYWMVTTEVPIGKLVSYHSFNQNELQPLMEEHGYMPVATWQTIIGDIEEIIFVAEFESMAAYHQARVSLLSSIDWENTSRKLDPLTKNIRSTFLSAAPYSRIQ
jgi:hypothetical protein